jgi:hypothetical protein
MLRDRLPKALLESGAAFNSCVRPRTDTSGLDVWYLPAGQPNGWLVHGMEVRYGFDPSGRVVRDSSIIVERLRGAPPDTAFTLTIVVENVEELPTVGQLFFALANKKNFKTVNISTPRFVSALYNNEGQWMWIHATREKSGPH